MGIKEYVPPYLGTELSDFDLLTGVSFASGASGFDPLTAQLMVTTTHYFPSGNSQPSALSNCNASLNSRSIDAAYVQAVFTMNEQLDMFKEYKVKLERVAGTRRAAEIVSTSLHLIITGTDDLANTYFTTPFRRNYDLESYIEFVVQCASDFFKVGRRRSRSRTTIQTKKEETDAAHIDIDLTLLQKLYGLGARRMNIAGAPPIGCVPSQRTNAGGLERECVALYNQAAVIYNAALEKEIKRLNGSDVLDMIQRPQAYGEQPVSPHQIK
jgi:hypothetical protein